MNQREKILLCGEIDVFLRTQKRLRGPHPVWKPIGRPDQLDAKWPIEEHGSISRAHLAFRYNRVSTNEPSVSLIFERKIDCRIDVKPADARDGNPPNAAALGLKDVVYGTHIHRWKHNRSHVLYSLQPDEWEIPFKDEIAKSTQKLGHILAFICHECKIDFTPKQRNLTPPSKEELF